MKPGVPWSVKGIGPEAREAAKAAARQSGLTLGEWLNSVILDQPDDRPQPAAPGTPASDAGPSAIYDRLSSLAELLERLSGRQQDTAAGRYLEGQQPPARDRAALDALVARVEDNEQRTIEAFETVHERLEALGKQLTQPQNAGDGAAEAPALAAVESALRNIIDHIEASERRTHDTLHSLNTRISDAERARDAASGRNGDFEALAKLDGEVTRLAERIEEVRRSPEDVAELAQAAVERAARGELREVETRVEQLLSQAQIAMRQTASASGDLTKVRAEIEGLAQRLDDIKIEAASERDVHALQLAVEQLSDRLAQGPDARPFADFDRRLSDLARRLEQSQTQAGAMPDLKELEQRLVGLDQRIAEAARRKPDGQAMGMLERQMEGLSERLMATEQRLAGIATIERSMSQLYQSLEQTSTMAQNVAEEAATRVVEQLFAQLPPTSGAGASPELLALEEALGAVQREAQQSDRQTQETLQAVHETLEQIVDKLAELETFQGSHQQPSHQEAPEDTEGSAQGYAPVDAPTPPSPSTSHGNAWQRASDPFRSAGAAGSRNPPSHREGDQQGPDELQERAPGAPAQPIDDYIAAARRAAQLAAATPRAAAQAHPVEAPSRSNGLQRFFSFPAAKKSRMMNGAAVPVEVQGSMRKRLILGGLVLLAAVSAYALRGLYQQHEGASTTAITVPAEGSTGTIEAEPPKAMSPQSWLSQPEGAESEAAGLVTSHQPADLAEAIAGPAMGPGDVARAQSMLLRLGFDVGTADGRMSLKTANAIRLFQLQNGMAVTGEVGRELLTKLDQRQG